MAHLHSFDDTLSSHTFDTDLSPQTNHINMSAHGHGQFDYDDHHVPLSLNGMLSADESLPLGALDDMDASSAAAAAASLDAFLADQSPSISVPSASASASISMVPASSPIPTSVPMSMNMGQSHGMVSLMTPLPATATVANGAYGHMNVGMGIMNESTNGYVQGGGMQLAAGYPGYNLQHAASRGRTVGSHNMIATTSQSLFHYPMQPAPSTAGNMAMYGQAGAYPGTSYGMMHDGSTPMVASSTSPSYGYPMASYTGGMNMGVGMGNMVAMNSNGNSEGVPSSNASTSSGSSVSSPIAVAITPPQTSVPSPMPLPLNTDITGSVPTSPQSPSSGSASDDGESVRAAKENRKRKNRNGSSNGTGNNSNGNDDNNKKPVTEEEMQESKRQQRLMRNRASAQLSRERKKVYMKKLEGQLKELQQQNLSLTQQLTALKNENANLRQRSELLPTSSGYGYGHGSYPGSPDSHSSASDGSASPEHGYIPAPTQSYSHGATNAKRTRMAHHGHNHPSAAHHQMYAAIPPRVRAAGVVMFALMMSFTIFYNMAGIDFTSIKHELPTESTSGVVEFHSRVVLDDTSSHTRPASPSPSSFSGGVDTGVASPMPTKRSAVTPTPVVMPSLEKPSTLPYVSPADEYGLVVKQEGTTPAIVPYVVVKSEPSHTHTHVVGTDLELYDDTTSMMTNDDDDSSSVHSHQSTSSSQSSSSTGSLARVAQSDFELFQQWKKMIVDANLTLDMSSSYMFCPSAIQMRPQGPEKVKTHVHGDSHNESGISARLRRAGLPLPNTTDADQVIAAEAARLSPSNNRLRFWVPTPSVIAGGDWDPVHFQSPLTEIECQVSGIRPVIITNTATPTSA